VSDRLEDLLRLALAGRPGLEPTPAEVRAALRGARARPRRRLSRRPAGLRPALASSWAAIAAAVLVVALGTAVAVPQSRAALAGALDRLERFLGGGEAPGRPLPAGEPADVLNWLGDAAPGSPRVLASAGAERLVAFRERRTGGACFSLGRHLNECGDLAHWRERLAGGVVAPLFTTPGRAGGVVVWGIAEDPVARVELRYRDGGAARAAVPHNGFVLHAEPGRGPRDLVARDAGGRLLASADVGTLQFRFCARPEGCG